jgi:hypothetical protein
MILRSTMTDDDFNTDGHEVEASVGGARQLSGAARRALEEAAQRREEYRRREAALPRELGGRGGKEPVRYGDWEVKGLTSDF